MSSSLRAVGARASHRSFRKFLIVGAALTGTGLLVACAGSSGAGSTSAGGGQIAAPAPRAAARHNLNLNGRRALAAAPGAGPVSVSRSTSLVLSTQSIIYTAFLTVRVTTDQTVTGQATQAANMVSAVGGYVAGEQETLPQGTHASPQINIELKIPVAQYNPTMAKLQSLDKPISFSQQTRDVTQQVADVTSRVASAQAAITQLRALLKKAGSVSQLLSVQDQINNQESYLEALLAQQRALAHETSYATVSMVFIGHHAVVVEKPAKKIPGFSGGLRGGSHAFGLVVDWTLTALGSILPFLIPVALIGALVYASRRKLFRRKSPPAASPPAAEAP